MVKTAAALRSSTAFLEESPLTDQASLSGPHETPHRYASHETPHNHIPTKERIARKQPVFRGVCKLDPIQSKALHRCVLIIDAVIRRADHSSAIYRAWKGRSPLKRLLWATDEKLPTLDLFILKQGNSGITIDVETLLSELVTVWAKSGRQIDLEVAHKLIDLYFSIAVTIRSNDEMHLIFEAANRQIGEFL